MTHILVTHVLIQTGKIIIISFNQILHSNATSIRLWIGKIFITKQKDVFRSSKNTHYWGSLKHYPSAHCN
jgi:hypothetical protein